MRLRPLALALLAGLAGLPVEAGAQMVRVTQNPVDIVVPFTGGGFGVGVNESARLIWRGSFLGVHKITVQTALPVQRYDLSVDADVEALFATSVGPVDLSAGAPPQDFIVNIITPVGRNARLRYEATAAPAAEAGVDVHTVVYTITQQ